MENGREISSPESKPEGSISFPPLGPGLFLNSCVRDSAVPGPEDLSCAQARCDFHRELSMAGRC